MGNRKKSISKQQDIVTAKPNKQVATVDKKSKKKNKKPGFFAGLGNFFVAIWNRLKETFSELKMVTWPSRSKTVKQTSVVIAVVLFFIVVIGLANAGLIAIYNLLI